VVSKVDSCLKALERHEDLKNEIKESRDELRDGQQELRQEIQEGHKQILNAVRDKEIEKPSSK
ncbi:hypothetical protein FRC02_002587, partial [Tulasnella sp. 418]